MVDNDAVLEQIYEDLLEAGFDDCIEDSGLGKINVSCLVCLEGCGIKNRDLVT